MVSAAALLIGAAFGWAAWTCGGLLEQREWRRRLVTAIDPTRIGPSWFHLFWREKKLQTQRIKLFPDFLDLFGLGLSAGLSMEKAWSLGVAKLPEGVLKEDLLLYEQFIQWGRSRREAFRAVSRRLRDSQLTMILVLIEQALNQGQELRSVVLDQSRGLRQRRWTQLERRAQTAGIRLLLPVFLFILPAVFLILFAPLYLAFSTGKLFL